MPVFDLAQQRIASSHKLMKKILERVRYNSVLPFRTLDCRMPHSEVVKVLKVALMEERLSYQCSLDKQEPISTEIMRQPESRVYAQKLRWERPPLHLEAVLAKGDEFAGKKGTSKI